MNSFTQQIKDSRQQSEIQSFYEPALRVLGHLFEVKKQNLRNKGYDENLCTRQISQNPYPIRVLPS
ncbi:hypothetical protein [Acinetobacter baumannii]|uniref:hypothetical protein n=1 Tax=Acinetobacter baumannii TaxID=470 RepID=UPI0011245639|nr:hypothetical protein [Acinetobacter baumannii]